MGECDGGSDRGGRGPDSMHWGVGGGGYRGGCWKEVEEVMATRQTWTGWRRTKPECRVDLVVDRGRARLARLATVGWRRVQGGSSGSRRGARVSEWP